MGKHFIKLLPALLLFYIGIRSASLSFTHDEALSYLIVKGETSIEGTANHHLLNTWLMAAFSLISESEFCLRMPGMIGFILYAFFSFRILKNQKFLLLLFFWVPALFFNNYLLDYFSLARGYGLSIGLMFASLYYLFSLEKKIWTHTLLCLGFGALAVLANLNLINFFIAISFVCLLQLVNKNKQQFTKSFFKKSIPILITLVLFLLACAQRLLLLKKNEQLYYGVDSILYSWDSIVIWSLDLSLLPDDFLLYLKIALLIVWLTVTLQLLRKFDLQSKLAKIWILVNLIITGLLIEHIFFAALYPQNRTFIYFLPIAVMFVGLAIEDWLKSKFFEKRNGIIIIICAFIGLHLTYQFGRRMNFQQVIEWSYDSGTKQVAETAAALSRGTPTEIQHNWIFGPALKYYQISRNYPIKLRTLEEPRDETVHLIYEWCNSEELKQANWGNWGELKGHNACLYIK